MNIEIILFLIKIEIIDDQIENLTEEIIENDYVEEEIIEQDYDIDIIELLEESNS